MKKILFLTGLFSFLFLTAGIAQNSASFYERNPGAITGEEIMERRLQSLKTELSLSRSQTKKIRAVNKDFALKLENIRENQTVRTDQMAAMEELQTEIMTSYKEYMTAEQYLRWDTHIAEQKAKYEDRIERSGKGQ